MEKPLKFEEVSVYFGSGGAYGIYKDRAVELIEMVLRRGSDVLIYGPAVICLGEELADLPSILSGVPNTGCCITCPSRAEEERLKKTDAFIIIAGGEIIDELPQIIARAEKYGKRVYLLNINGFFDSFLASDDTSLGNTIASTSVDELMKEMEVSD